tara:strand:- start:4243 stop:4533 length:291 start_codon:yes stop_codon:yes gene_type:complete
MPRKKYTQRLIDEVHADKLAGDTLRELSRNHNLTMNQLTYVLYSRVPTETMPNPIISVDQFNNKSQKALGSAPPSQNVWIDMWQRVKSMLGWDVKK